MRPLSDEVIGVWRDVFFTILFDALVSRVVRFVLDLVTNFVVAVVGIAKPVSAGLLLAPRRDRIG